MSILFIDNKKMHPRVCERFIIIIICFQEKIN